MCSARSVPTDTSLSVTHVRRHIKSHIQTSSFENSISNILHQAACCCCCFLVCLYSCLCQKTKFPQPQKVQSFAHSFGCKLSQDKTSQDDTLTLNERQRERRRRRRRSRIRSRLRENIKYTL